MDLPVVVAVLCAVVAVSHERLLRVIEHVIERRAERSRFRERQAQARERLLKLPPRWMWRAELPSANAPARQ